MSGVADDAAPSWPRIGISSCFFHADEDRKIFKGKTLLYLEQSMAWWVQRGGGLPVLVPTTHPQGQIVPGHYAADLDGLLLHGGSDVCPRSYGEEPLRDEWEGDEIRDRYEIELLRAFLDADKPVLGICRGVQILNVAFGGTLWQDQREQGATERVHRSQELYDRNLHEVRFEPGSHLAKLYPDHGSALVNSIHHQAIKDVGHELEIEARSSDDGIVEAVRWTGPSAPVGAYAFGVQWHPEFFEGVDDGSMLDNDPILREFLDAALEARR